MILALRVERDIDLGPFSMYLRQHGINHRVNEAGEQQELWVVDDADETVVRDSYAALQRGDIQLEVVKRESVGPSVGQRLIETVWRVPVTMVFIIVTGLLFPVTLGIETGEVESRCKRTHSATMAFPNLARMPPANAIKSAPSYLHTFWIA